MSTVEEFVADYRRAFEELIESYNDNCSWRGGGGLEDKMNLTMQRLRNLESLVVLSLDALVAGNIRSKEETEEQSNG